MVTSTSTYEKTTTTTPTGPVETAPCPSVLPQCMNTWLYITGCIDNTDTSCYCPSSSFVSEVYDCLSAFGASNWEISAAQTYFQGICAPYIPSNPAIVTACSTIVVTETTGPTVTAFPVSSTTIHYFTTVVTPYTESTGTSVSYSTTVISTIVTVPQVAFTTVSGSSVGLVTGTPAPATFGNGIAPQTTFSSVAATATTGSNASGSTSSTGAVFTGAASRTGMTYGAMGAAALVAVFAI